MVLFLGLLTLLSCGHDYILKYDVITYEEVIEVTEEIIIVEEEIIIVVEDTAPDYLDIWVDSFTQPISVNGVDILWVIDPSGSMHDDAPRILAGIDAMMNALPSSGWRLAIIPADYRFSEQQQQFPLVPGDTVEMAEQMYSNAINGAFEAGFDATYGYIMNNTYSSTWMRPDAALLVVYVSDENEQSFSYFNSTNNFISWYSSLRANVYLASVIHLDPSSSLCNTSPMNNGDEYIDATNYFNGQIIDICSEDWTSGVQDASNQIEPYDSWTLSKTPSDPNYIYIFVNSQPFLDWYYVSSENKVYFTTLPQGNSLVEIAYYIY